MGDQRCGLLSTEYFIQGQDPVSSIHMKQSQTNYTVAHKQASTYLSGLKTEQCIFFNNKEWDLKWKTKKYLRISKLVGNNIPK